MDWINEKKVYWRNYCESHDESNFKIHITNVKGNSENVVERCFNDIVEIGQKLEVKLKETVFKKTFSDLKKSEYLRNFDKLIFVYVFIMSAYNIIEDDGPDTPEHKHEYNNALIVKT